VDAVRPKVLNTNRRLESQEVGIAGLQGALAVLQYEVTIGRGAIGLFDPLLIDKHNQCS
jgi:hypothetical protein